MRRLSLLVTIAALVASACTAATEPPVDGAPRATDEPAATDQASAPSTSTPSLAGTVPAPEFPIGLDWLNVAQPLSLESLRGKAVLLDFWTYGCINCIHIIPDLKRLEALYPDELVVIGVHSAKFANEANTDNIREVVQRYELEHPVVNDEEFVIWNSWQARAWPTVALIDPAGNVVGTHAGEGVYDVVGPVLARLLDEFDQRGELNREPIVLDLERDNAPDTLLSYPGKVFADPASDRIYIADSGHHRIIAATDDGEVLAVYGDGVAGYENGAATAARFSSPQGLALVGKTLYVADTGNHSVRSIDLATGTVGTLAGTGRKGWPPTAGPVDEVSLASPWALAADGSLLYVANAGTHQIWVIDVAAGSARPLVGSVIEGTANGPLPEAELAQPSGLALRDGVLYFADSESSSIRSAEVALPDGMTALVAGGVASLFEFGDIDGVGSEARFQHPLGVAFHGDRLLVADTYNSKIKVIDVATGEASTLFGAEQGWEDGVTPRFHEPGGLSVEGDVAWVADTNNHVIRRIDLGTGETTTLVLSGLDAFTAQGDSDYSGPTEVLPATTSGVGTGALTLNVTLPDGFKVNEEASSSLFLSEDGGIATFPERTDLTGATFPITVDVDFHFGTGTITGDLNLVWCREDAEGLCFFERLRYVAPVDVSTDGGAPAEIELALTVEEPKL